MFEIHGWATLRESFDEAGEDDEKLHAIFARLRRQIDENSWSLNSLVDLRYINGTPYLTVTGDRNHRISEGSELFELFHTVAEIAPGSYGLVYVMDDEAQDIAARNEFEVWVLCRGQFTRRSDAYLSPIIPTIEDPSV
jgi:hypothetical protein